MTSLGQFLKTVRIFENLTDEEIEILVPMFEVRNTRVKERVIREGETSDLFYVIRTGHFNVTKGTREQFLTILGPKDYFGEASLFHNVRRTANVTSSEESQLLILPRNQFQQFLFSYPLAANRILFQMLKEVFFRLDETSNELMVNALPEDIAANAINKLLR